jgi:hypothetical protein
MHHAIQIAKRMESSIKDTQVPELLSYMGAKSG